MDASRRSPVGLKEAETRVFPGSAGREIPRLVKVDIILLCVGREEGLRGGVCVGLKR